MVGMAVAPIRQRTESTTPRYVRVRFGSVRFKNRGKTASPAATEIIGLSAAHECANLTHRAELVISAHTPASRLRGTGQQRRPVPFGAEFVLAVKTVAIAEGKHWPTLLASGTPGK
jgi:hypothetical protein